jgi:uncharacterized protein
MVVSNTSPIINLACIEQLDLLPELYATIVIPPAVFHETTVVLPNAPGAATVRSAPWIQCREVANRSLVASLRLELDPGEAEAIACALEGSATLLLIDERRGRRVAQQLGISVIGLVGVLLLAKRRGLVAQIRPLLDGLRQRAGFWMSEALYARVLQEAEENR